jgi:5-methylthioadenosine/S-adenosylhomocysteine deaminase
MMSDLLIKNCKVLQTGDSRTAILPQHDIFVRGNRIESIQPTGQADESHFRTAIDSQGMLAMPGLINTHSHVPMVIFRGLAEDVSIEKWFNDYMWPLESNLQAEDVYWGMQLGLAEMIEAGVTTVADHYFYMDEAAQAVEKAGTRALLGWAMFSSNGLPMIEKTGESARSSPRTRRTPATANFYAPVPKKPPNLALASISTLRRKWGRHAPAWKNAA